MKLDEIHLSFNRDWVEVEYEGYRVGLELGKEAKEVLGPNKIFITTIGSALNMLMIFLGQPIDGTYLLPRETVEAWVDKKIKDCTPI